MAKIPSDLDYETQATDEIAKNIAFARVTDPNLNKAYTEGFESGVGTLLRILRDAGIFVPVIEDVTVNGIAVGGKVKRFIPAHLKP